MGIYTYKFVGHSPVGAVAMIIASSKQQAMELLEAKLEAIGLAQTVDATKLVKINSAKSEAHILLNGDY